MSDKAALSPGDPRHALRPNQALKRALAWAAVAAALVAVFAAYLRPDMAFQMAQQLWSCF